MGSGQIGVWCLLGRKAGDNNQVCALADELALPCDSKTIQARPWELLAHMGTGATLAGIDRSASSALQPPWPDLVITAGRRNEPVAQWIRNRSAGHTRLVHIGRPWASLSAWDLIVTTPQYFLPVRSNIVHNSLPLHRYLPEQLSAAGERLLPKLSALPRPWIVLLVGGDSGPFVFTADKARRLGALANDVAGQSKGTLLFSDSARTGRQLGDMLQRQLHGPSYIYRSHYADENPYQGLLALADAFIVTGESMSMLAETAAMRRPLYIFDMGDGATPWWRLPHSYRYKPLSFRLAMRFAPQRMRRDVSQIQRALVDSGRAAWLQQNELPVIPAVDVDREWGAVPDIDTGSVVSSDELRQTADAVRRLFLPH